MKPQDFLKKYYPSYNNEDMAQILQIYGDLKIKEYQDSLVPKTNIWGVSLDEARRIDFTKDAGPRDM